jgi:thioredoxin reductase (NADPH)
MYDLIIIGAGPAGFTAGIYAARREMKTLIIGKEPGGQLIWASEIENYPGFKSINNYDLISKMQEQAQNLGVEIKIDEVKKIEKKAESFHLHTNKEVFEAKTIIIAIGLAPRRLAIPGEEELIGRGVTYCANCDGPFYKNKAVAVVGGGNSALDAAEILAKIAKKVYLIHRRDQFRGFESLIGEVMSKENIEIVLNSEVLEIIGEPTIKEKERLKKIKIKNILNNEEREIDIDGLFIEIGRIANTDLVSGLAEMDEKSQIITDKHQMTKTPGLFAAGDVVSGEFKQITIACGEATVAALAAYKYLQIKAGKKSTIVLDRSV